MKYFVLLSFIMLLACTPIIQNSNTNITNSSLSNISLEEELLSKLKLRVENYTAQFELQEGWRRRCDSCNTWSEDSKVHYTNITVQKGIVINLSRNTLWVKGSLCNGGCHHTRASFTEVLNFSTGRICRTRISIYDMAGGQADRSVTAATENGCYFYNELDVDRFVKDFLLNNTLTNDTKVYSKAYIPKIPEFGGIPDKNSYSKTYVPGFNECFWTESAAKKNIVCFDSQGIITYADWSQTSKPTSDTYRTTDIRSVKRLR